jgi:hypothetical protein
MPKQIKKKFCDVYSYSDEICTSGDFNLEDKERSSRPMKIDIDEITTPIEQNLRYSTSYC